MSKCSKRLVVWLLLVVVSVAAGIVTDIFLKSRAFPIPIRLLGLAGMIMAHFPLKRTGKLLRSMGGRGEWGCTNRLMITDIYRCVRHPHHLSVGIFMTSLALLIGHWASFLIITISQWAWVVAFLFLVEEKELREKFGDEYREYSREVPMLFPKWLCLFRVFSKPIKKSH